MRDKPQRRGRGHAQRRRELYAADQAQREALARRDVAQQAAYKGVMLTMAKNTATARSALKEAHRTIARLQREAQREATLRQDLESSLRRRHPATWEIKGMHHVLDRETWRMRRDERFGQAYRDIQQKVHELKAERMELKKRLRADGRRPGPARRGVTAEGRCTEVCYTVEPRDTPADVCGALETLAMEKQGLKRKVQRAAALRLVRLIKAARRARQRRARLQRAVHRLKEGLAAHQRRLGHLWWSNESSRADILKEKRRFWRRDAVWTIRFWVFPTTGDRLRRAFRTMKERYLLTPRWKLDLLWLRRNDSVGTNVRDEDARREGSMRAAFAEAFGRLVQLEFELGTMMKERSTALNAAEHEWDSPPQGNKRQKTEDSGADGQWPGLGDIPSPTRFSVRGLEQQRADGIYRRVTCPRGSKHPFYQLEDGDRWCYYHEETMEWQIQPSHEGKGGDDTCLAYTVAVWDDALGDARSFAPWDQEAVWEQRIGAEWTDAEVICTMLQSGQHSDEDAIAHKGGQETGRDLLELLWLVLCVVMWLILCVAQLFAKRGGGDTRRRAPKRRGRTCKVQGYLPGYYEAMCEALGNSDWHEELREAVRFLLGMITWPVLCAVRLSRDSLGVATWPPLCAMQIFEGVLGMVIWPILGVTQCLKGIDWRHGVYIYDGMPAEDVDGSGRREASTTRRREADRRGRAGNGNAGP